MHPILSPSVYSSVPTWQKLKLENRLNNFAALCLETHGQSDSDPKVFNGYTYSPFFAYIWKSKKIWNIFKFVQFEWLVSVWPCENNFFWKTARNGLPLAIQRLRFPMAQLLGEKGKKGWLLPQPLDRSVQMASLGIVLKKLPRISIDSTRGGYQTFFRNRQSDDFSFDFNLQIGSG